MPTRTTLPDSLYRHATDADGSPATLARQAPTPRPIHHAQRPRLCSRKESGPSCIQRGGASVLSRVFPRQIRESPFFCGLDRWAVHHRDARLCFPIGSEANLPAQGVVKSVERSVEAPSAVAGVNRGAIREVPRQVAPLAPSTHQIKNCVDDFTPVELGRPSSGLPVEQRGNLGPLLVSQVRRISASHDGCVLRKKSPRLTL